MGYSLFSNFILEFNYSQQNPPEIQIDLVGPRTPSPTEEELNVELPVLTKQYKFKVEYDQETMFNEEEEEEEEEDDGGSQQNYYESKSSVVDVATTPEMVFMKF